MKLNRKHTLVIDADYSDKKPIFRFFINGKGEDVFKATNEALCNIISSVHSTLKVETTKKEFAEHFMKNLTKLVMETLE